MCRGLSIKMDKKRILQTTKNKPVTKENKMPFDSIEEVIADFKEGKMVIITDDESRENEGDLIFAADTVTPEKINFMAKYGRGLICVPMADAYLERLGLRNMVEENEDQYRTAFTVSVDARLGTTTGISAFDRARTIEVLADPKSTKSDLTIPGHIFPLRAKKGGVLIRSGHTEASIDLARLAGLSPVAVICEIMNDDGSMARRDDLVKFAKEHKIKMGTIADLIKYRRRNDKLVKQVAEATIPNEYGEWRMICYESEIDHFQHLALVKGEITEEPTLIRVHSECFTGDILGSNRCDCGEQLDGAMKMIAEEGKGILLYIRQEGRGIGLANKLKAYHWQEKGLDTVEANEKLGFKPDLREYGTGAQIIEDLGARKLKLITNNPRKIVGLEGYGLSVVERVPMEIKPNQHNHGYLKTKKNKLGHMLENEDLSDKE